MFALQSLIFFPQSKPIGGRKKKTEQNIISKQRSYAMHADDEIIDG